MLTEAEVIDIQLQLHSPRFHDVGPVGVFCDWCDGQLIDKLLTDRRQLQAEISQERVRLAGVLTQLEGHDDPDVIQGVYGWSPTYDKARALRQQLTGHGCLFAGPGRGDCHHFVGLPGAAIPGQHDGTDDTVDVYGRPNGWCQVCWQEHMPSTHYTDEIVALKQERDRLVEKLREVDSKVGSLIMHDGEGKKFTVREWCGLAVLLSTREGT